MDVHRDHDQAQPSGIGIQRRIEGLENGPDSYLQFANTVMATEYIGPIYNPTPVDEEKIPLAGIRIQPNPATDHILVSGLSPDARIELFSLTGTQILILHPVGSTTSVALGTIPPGIYVVKIREGNEVAFRKIVKTR